MNCPKACFGLSAVSDCVFWSGRINQYFITDIMHYWWQPRTHDCKEWWASPCQPCCAPPSPFIIHKGGPQNNLPMLWTFCQIQFPTQLIQWIFVSASLEFSKTPSRLHTCCDAAGQDLWKCRSGFWQEKRCVAVAGQHWGLFSISKQLRRLFHAAAVACCGHASKFKDEGKSCINKRALSIQISPGVTTYFILRTGLLCERRKWHSLHVIFLTLLPLSMLQIVLFW